MKKLILALCLVAMMIVPAHAGAILDSIGLGVETGFGWDREIKLSDWDDANVDVDSQTFLLTVPIKFAEMVTITPVIGGAMAQIDADHFGADTDLGLAVGIRGEADVYKVKSENDIADGITFTLFGSYLYSQMEVGDVQFGGIEIKDVDVKNTIRAHDLEAGAKVSKKIGITTPYLGVAVSTLLGEVEIGDDSVVGHSDIEAENNFGLRCGVAIQPIQDLTISVDGKLIDQTAVVGKVAWKF